VEFVVPAGTGGGADQMARFIQGVATKHKLTNQPIVVVNKGGGAGAEAFLDVKGDKGNPHKIVITLSNLFTTPLGTAVPFNWRDMTPVAMLALDEIEIARPIIAQSPLLKDQDLLRVLVEATIEHQIEVARRPRISGRIADAIIDKAEPACLTALAGNRTAEISEAGLERLIEQSRRIAALRAPLTRHPRLNDQLATQLYQWVGQALREAIGERFRVDEARLAEAIETVTRPKVAQGAELMGLPEAYVLPRGVSAALHVAGDGVCVPAVRWLADALLEPLLDALPAPRV
jgi:hypothetical protein